MYHICTISDILRQRVDSLAQWLELWFFYPGDTGSNPTWDVGFFFKTMHHVLVANFHIRKIGARPGWTFESFSHFSDILVIINDYFLEMGMCYVPLHHSFIRDYQ